MRRRRAHSRGGPMMATTNKRTAWAELQAGIRSENANEAYRDEARIAASGSSCIGSAPTLGSPRRSSRSGWGPRSRLSPVWRVVVHARRWTHSRSWLRLSAPISLSAWARTCPPTDRSQSSSAMGTPWCAGQAEAGTTGPVHDGLVSGARSSRADRVGQVILGGSPVGEFDPGGMTHRASEAFATGLDALIHGLERTLAGNVPSSVPSTRRHLALQRVSVRTRRSATRIPRGPRDGHAK